eukprot:1109259-Pyramimonas_sp.AAC.1
MLLIAAVSSVAHSGGTDHARGVIPRDQNAGVPPCPASACRLMRSAFSKAGRSPRCVHWPQIRW